MVEEALSSVQYSLRAVAYRLTNRPDLDASKEQFARLQAIEAELNEARYALVMAEGSDGQG
jgi:hypothetical protein